MGRMANTGSWPICKYNSMIECTDRRNCGKCGWNPSVEIMRKTQIKEERVKLPQPKKFDMVRCEECMYRPQLPTWCIIHDRKIEMNECCVYGMRRK